jgi:hypothetical protein
MGLVVATYVILLIIFLVMSSLIFRHAVKYGYLSPRFKTLVVLFGAVSLITIVLTFYFLIKLFGAPSTPSFPTFSTGSELNF